MTHHSGPHTTSTPSTTSPPSSPLATPSPYSAPVLTDNGSTGDEPSMKDKAADSAQAGKQAAGEVAQTATDKATDVAQEAKTQARHVIGQAQDQLRGQASTQHRNLVGNLRSLGDQLNSMAEPSDQPGQATDLVAEAGSRVHSAASWLDEREPGQLLDELRSFARRKPATFVLGALAAGVVAGRLTRGVVAVHQDDGDPSAQAHGDTSAQRLGDPLAQPHDTPSGAVSGYRPVPGGYVDGPGSVPGTYDGDSLQQVRP